MKTIEVYDPALCCPTGVCGPSVDPALVAFAADLDWLKKKGAAVTRFNLAQQPGAFAENGIVRQELAAKGTACLPLVLVDGVIASSGKYPKRQELAELCGIAFEAPAKAAFILPMADSGCCPLPDNGPPIQADGDYCPWPGASSKGGCC